MEAFQEMLINDYPLDVPKSYDPGPPGTHVHRPQCRQHFYNLQLYFFLHRPNRHVLDNQGRPVKKQSLFR
jgi:hypothetical protein